MRRIICDICKLNIDAYENYDVDGYSQFVTVQTMDSRKYGNEEYQICNNCFEKILNFVADMRGRKSG